MKNIYYILAVLGLCSFFLASCGNSERDISYNYPDNPDYSRSSKAGKFFGKSDIMLYKQNEAEKN